MPVNVGYCGRDAIQSDVDAAVAQLRSRMSLPAPVRVRRSHPEDHIVTIDGAQAFSYKLATNPPTWEQLDEPTGAVRIGSSPIGDLGYALPFGNAFCPRFAQTGRWGLTWKCRSKALPAGGANLWNFFIGQISINVWWCFQHFHTLNATNWIMTAGDQPGFQFYTAAFDAMMDTGVAVDTNTHIFAVRADGTKFYAYIDHQPCGEMTFPVELAGFDGGPILVGVSGGNRNVILEWMAQITEG